MHKSGTRYRKHKIPKVAQDVYDYILNNPGTTATIIARDLGIKHRNYVYQVIGSFEQHEGLLVSEEKDKYYPFNLQDLDDKGWIE